MKHLPQALVMTSIMIATPAFADGVYDGATVANNHTAEFCSGLPAGASCTQDALALRAYLGKQFNPNVALEAGYQFNDTIHAGSYKLDEQAIHIDSIAIWPISQVFNFNARVGLYANQVKLASPSADYRGRYQNIGFRYGIGADYRITRNLSLGFEATRYQRVIADAGNDDIVRDANYFLGLGIKYYF